MLNGYRKNRLEAYRDARMHPSSRQFSLISSYDSIFIAASIILFFAMAITSMVLWGTTFIAGAVSTSITLIMTFAIIRRLATSYTIESYQFNNRILPLEYKFNSMSKQKRREYVGLMEYIYLLHHNDDRSARYEWEKACALFDLNEEVKTAPRDARAVKLDEELRMAREYASIIQELNNNTKS